MSGDRFVTRVNEMAGPYQMFAELCDLVVFEADEATCALEKQQSKKGGKKKKKKKPVFAKYYQEVPVSFMPTFVSQHLHKSKFMSICFDYGHGKFSEMDTLHSKYIGTRAGPTSEAIGIPNLYKQKEEQGDILTDLTDNDGSSRTTRPSKRMGPTGAGVDSNFLHPVFSIFDLNDEDQVEDVHTIAEIMQKDRTHIYMHESNEENSQQHPAVLLGKYSNYCTYFVFLIPCMFDDSILPNSFDSFVALLQGAKLKPIKFCTLSQPITCWKI